jgi:hypothetical protein
MAISPIDVQTNMAHMHDVAKNTHAHNTAVETQHQYLDREAETESNKKKDTVHQNNESEQAKLNPDSEEKNSRHGIFKQTAVKKEEEKSDLANQIDNPALGQRVDFKR